MDDIDQIVWIQTKLMDTIVSSGLVSSQYSSLICNTLLFIFTKVLITGFFSTEVVNVVSLHRKMTDQYYFPVCGKIFKRMIFKSFLTTSLD